MLPDPTSAPSTAMCMHSLSKHSVVSMDAKLGHVAVC